MAPVLCVGETLDEREAGVTDDKVGGQVRAALARSEPRRPPTAASSPTSRSGRSAPAERHAGRRELRQSRRFGAVLDDDCRTIGAGAAGALRRQREAGQRRRAHGDARDRRRPGRRRVPRSRRIRSDRPILPLTDPTIESHRPSVPVCCARLQVGAPAVRKEGTTVLRERGPHRSTRHRIADPDPLHPAARRAWWGLSDMFGGVSGASLAGSTVVERNLDRMTVVVVARVHVHHGPALAAIDLTRHHSSASYNGSGIALVRPSASPGPFQGRDGEVSSHALRACVVSCACSPC